MHSWSFWINFGNVLQQLLDKNPTYYTEFGVKHNNPTPYLLLKTNKAKNSQKITNINRMKYKKYIYSTKGGKKKQKNKKLDTQF